jgi:hypothetical protein
MAEDKHVGRVGNVSTNNSHSIRFDYSASGAATVYFQDSTGGVCDAVTGWQGCANGGGTIGWHIWIRANPTYYDWCELNNSNGCKSAERVGIHEAGHVGGSIDHYLTSENYTVMTTSSPSKPNNGYSTQHLQPCDEARLQLLYDVATLSGDYSTCLDDLANSGANGLKTDLSASPASYTACAGETVTISGRLNVHDYSDYLVLGGNNLAGRTILIDRGATPNYTSATSTSVSTGNNWSKSFTASNITFDYNAHYDRPSAEGLESSPDRGFSITWLSPQVPCD